MNVQEAERHPRALLRQRPACQRRALWKQQGVIPGYEAPTVYYDDGITIWTSDPLTSNVAYDSPFTPIPRPA